MENIIRLLSQLLFREAINVSVKWSPPGVGVFTISAIARIFKWNFKYTCKCFSFQEFHLARLRMERNLRSLFHSLRRCNQANCKWYWAGRAEITAVLVMGPLDELGSIRILEVTNPGAGYLEAPKVRFYGAGQITQAVAKIGTDPFPTLFGRVTEIAYRSRWRLYTSWPIRRKLGRIKGFNRRRTLAHSGAN